MGREVDREQPCAHAHALRTRQALCTHALARERAIQGALQRHPARLHERRLRPQPLLEAGPEAPARRSDAAAQTQHSSIKVKSRKAGYIAA